jgi:abequosyltransferase
MTEDDYLKPLISICIPTRGRSDILENTLNSIFNSNIPYTDFELVIYDSSDDDSTQKVVKNHIHKNLIYKKGENFGYYNLIEVLRMGSGSYLKLHNDYSILNEGSLVKMVTRIKELQLQKPLLVFTNGALKLKGSLATKTFNDFMQNISYFSTWSNVFGIWNEDFDILKDMDVNPMFPHTSLLYSLHDKESYFIDNDKLFDNKIVSGKGGYDLFETFGVNYLGILNNCSLQGIISLRTLKFIKRDMLINFFSYWFSETGIRNNRYTFIQSNIKPHILVNYSIGEYWLMKILAYLRVMVSFIKSRLLSNKTQST